MIHLERLLLGSALLLLASLVAPVIAKADPNQPVLTVNLAYIGSENDAALLGVRQGVAEGNQQGVFLGQRYQVRNLPDSEIGTVSNPVPSAIFAALDSQGLRRLSEANPGVPIFNLIEGDPQLRGACIPNLLHVVPDRKMREDAIAQWRAKAPDSAVEALAWHPKFEKYAARQLNDRFTKAFSRAMDDFAWSGWAATKMLTDSVARAGTADPARLLAYLRDELQFDGQKGVTMNFRPNGQLRQVLLLVRDDQIVGEAPVKGVVGVEELDSLGPVQCPTPQTAQQ